jgi:K+-transporting ATPase ATPase C chain
MLKIIRQAIFSVIVLTIITGIVYPLAVTGMAQLIFPKQANGSIVVRDGKTVGSSLIGQPFSDSKYFWGRPSATSPQPYNGAASSGSNLGPSNPALVLNVQAAVKALRAADPGNNDPVPVDLITASGSGLDPHITPAAANYQAARVAKARNIDESKVSSVISSCTEDRQLSLLGEPRVNVLCLNLKLDEVH